MVLDFLFLDHGNISFEVQRQTIISRVLRCLPLVGMYGITMPLPYGRIRCDDDYYTFDDDDYPIAFSFGRE